MGKTSEDKVQFSKREKLSTTIRYVLPTLNSVSTYVFIELLSIFPMEIQLSTFGNEDLAILDIHSCLANDRKSEKLLLFQKVPVILSLPRDP